MRNECPQCGCETKNVYCSRHCFFVSQQLNKYSKSNRNKIKNMRKRETLQNVKKQSKCLICGESNTVCLDYHHLPQYKKEFTIAHYSSYTKKQMFDEITKCIVLCSNCHRKHHAVLYYLVPIFTYKNKWKLAVKNNVQYKQYV